MIFFLPYLIFIIIISLLCVQNFALQIANQDLQARLLLLEEQIKIQQLLLNKLDNNQLFLKTAAIATKNYFSWLVFGFCVLGSGVIFVLVLASFSPKSESIIKLVQSESEFMAQHVSENSELISQALLIIQKDNKLAQDLLVDRFLMIENSIASLEILSHKPLGIVDITCETISKFST